MQLYQPDWGGWRTVSTANTLGELEIPARVLGWQTGKLLRLVDPDGQIVRELQPQTKAAV